MADRYPLVYNPSANQLQELQSGDSIDLGGGSLKNTVFSGIITATGFSGDGSALTNLSVTETSTLDNVLARGSTSSRSVTFGPITGTEGTFSGDVTVANLTAANVTIAGTITYDDVTHVDSQGIGTFRQGINVVGQSELDNINVTGVSTFSSPASFSQDVSINGRIVGAGVSNVIPFLYANLSDLPSATTYHGAFAHVHATGKAYYAHAGAWVELVSNNVETSGNVLVGSGITMYAATGIVSATAFYGDGSQLTGVAAAGSGGGALDITSCLFI